MPLGVGVEVVRERDRLEPLRAVGLGIAEEGEVRDAVAWVAGQVLLGAEVIRRVRDAVGVHVTADDRVGEVIAAQHAVAVLHLSGPLRRGMVRAALRFDASASTAPALLSFRVEVVT